MVRQAARRPRRRTRSAKRATARRSASGPYRLRHPLSTAPASPPAMLRGWRTTASVQPPGLPSPCGDARPPYPGGPPRPAEATMTRSVHAAVGPAVPPEPTADRLLAEADRLIDFARGSLHPDGGFALLDDAGAPQLEEPGQTWHTCRMTHVFAIAHLLGDEDAAAYVDHGLRALQGRLLDAEHGGWFAAVGADGPTQSTKEAYTHAFVVLAASSAAVVGRPGARDLLDEALGVVDERFWDDGRGAVTDVWDSAWTDLEQYRGANANMHMVEALLAASDVTGDDRWRQRALRTTELLIHGFARRHGWRLPEHYDEDWQPLPEYNTDDRAHAFRPYGVTPGHLLEWSRLCLHLRAALGDAAPDWLLGDA